MAIWQHDSVSASGEAKNLALRFKPEHCIYCRTSLVFIGGEVLSSTISSGIEACSTCGWWRFLMFQKRHLCQAKTFGAVGVLKQLELADISQPVEEVRRYLLAKYQARFDLHPRLFEETVASVFGDLGYLAKATAYTADGGIDVILVRDHTEIGVQVKRYRDSIEVEQIRSLVGALVLRGLTRGIFVTTSAFQRGAQKVGNSYRKRGYGLKLVDAERFYAMMKLAQRPMYTHFAEFPVDQCYRRKTLLKTSGFRFGLTAKFLEEILLPEVVFY